MELDVDFVNDAISVINLYFTPSVITLGLLGNAVAGIVFLCTDMKTTPTVHYLIALSISDSLYLIALLVRWVERFNISIYNTAGWCQFFYYIFNACQFLSVWFVVCVSADRFAVHAFPGRRHSVCTVIRAKIVVLAFSISAIVIYLNMSLMTGVDEYPYIGDRCIVRQMFSKIMNILEKFDIVLNYFIPFILILLFNVITCVNLYRNHSRRERVASNNVHHAEGANDVTRQSDCSAIFDTTLTLLIMSSIVVVLNLPQFILRVKQMIALSTNTMLHISHTQRFLQTVFLSAYYTNFAFKFLLYTAVFKKFRNAMFTLCCCHGFLCRKLLPAKASPIIPGNGEDIPMNGIEETMEITLHTETCN